MSESIDSFLQWVRPHCDVPWNEQLRADLLVASVAALAQRELPIDSAVARSLAHPLERLRLSVAALAGVEPFPAVAGTSLIHEALAIEPPEASALALTALIPSLTPAQRSTASQHALDRLAGQQPEPLTWRLIVPAALNAGEFERAIGIADGIERGEVYGIDQYGEALHDLAQGLPLSALPAVVNRVIEFPTASIWRQRALLAIAERAPEPEYLRLAEEAARHFPNPEWAVRALTALHPHAPAATQHRLRATIAEIAAAQPANLRVACLAQLVPLTPEEELSAVLDAILAVLPVTRLATIVDCWEFLVPHLGVTGHDAAVMKNLRALGRTRDVVEVSSTMRWLAPYLTERTRPLALEVARRVVQLGREAPPLAPQRLDLEHGLLHGALALLAIAASAPPPERELITDEALALYAESQIPAFQELLLQPLRDLLGHSEWDDLLMQLYHRLHDGLATARLNGDGLSVIGTLVSLMPYLPEHSLRELIALASVIELRY